MVNGTNCLYLTFQIQLSIDNISQDFHNKFYILQASAFRGQEINSTSFIKLPFLRCGLPPRNLTRYIGNNVEVKTIRYLIISPKEMSLIEVLMSFHWKKYSHLELRQQRYGLNVIREISFTLNEPIQWQGVGILVPVLQFVKSVQNYLQK